MNTLTPTTLLTFTTIKKGHATGRTFTNTVEGFIDAVYNNHMHHNSFMQFQRAIAWDSDGNETEWENTFNDLALETQVSACIERDNECHAAITTWEVSE